MEIKQTSEIKTFFNVLDIMFSNSDEYDNLSKKDKDRNFFMINRRMAIKFPVQACRLSVLGINPEYALDSLRMITLQYKGKKPSWLYLKTAKEKEEKQVKLKYSDEAKDFYIKINEIDDKTFNRALETDPRKMQEILTKIDKQIKILSNKKTR